MPLFKLNDFGGAGDGGEKIEPVFTLQMNGAKKGFHCNE